MKVILAGSFMKDLRKAPRHIFEQFKERRDIFLKDAYHPLLRNHPLHGEWAGHRSINVTGDYRAIFHIKGDVNIFVRIGTHGELYCE